MALALTKEQLLVSKPRCDAVDIPQLGGEVFVRGLKAKEIIGMYERFGADKGDMPMLIFGVVDAEGNSIFSDTDLGSLMDMDYAIVAPMLLAVKRLTGLLPDIPKASGASS
jgi:hypothetical protein